MKQIQKILPSALTSELVQLGKAQTVMHRWEQVVGKTLANRSCPDRFDRGVLWVAVEGSAWAQELRLMKIKILQNLNEFSGQQDLFTDIRFGVRKLPPKDEEVVEAPLKNDAIPTTIQEIARRRLKKWQDVDPT